MAHLVRVAGAGPAVVVHDSRFEQHSIRGRQSNNGSTVDHCRCPLSDKHQFQPLRRSLTGQRAVSGSKDQHEKNARVKPGYLHIFRSQEVDAPAASSASSSRILVRRLAKVIVDGGVWASSVMKAVGRHALGRRIPRRQPGPAQRVHAVGPTRLVRVGQHERQRARCLG